MDINNSNTITLFGTCRLNKISKNNHLNNINFTHSTKEVLQMIKFLKGELDIPKPYSYLCFRGGIIGNRFIDYYKEFNDLFMDSDIFIIEICSNKKYIHNGYYLHHLAVDKRFVGYHKTSSEILNSFVLEKQSDDEIEKDILEIQKLLHPRKIVIVSHYNSKLNGEYLKDRNHLIQTLEKICKKHCILFVNPTECLSKFPQEEVMGSDLGHYTDKGADEFTKYMDNYISQKKYNFYV